MDIQELLCGESKSELPAVLQKTSRKYNCKSEISDDSTRSRRKTKIAQHTRKPWSEKEDYLLKKGYSKGLSWAMISSMYLPDRSRGCCWGRFKTLQMKSCKKKTQVWTDGEDHLLSMSIKKHEKLFIQAWNSVAQELQTRDWKECQIRYARMPFPLRRCKILMD